MSYSVVKKIPLYELGIVIIVVMVLAGWLPVNKGLSMSTATAVTFILAAASKFLFEYSTANKKLLLPSRILALLTFAIGVISILTVVFKFASLDNLLGSMPGHITGSENGMGLITAFSFMLIGISLYRITLNNFEKTFFSHLLSLIILFISLLSVIAYFFHENPFSGMVFYKPMEVVTAICFSMLAFSILMVDKHRGFWGDIMSKYQGGKIARVLIPIAIIVPAVMGFLQLNSEQTGLYTRPRDVVLITLARIIILVLFIWRCAVIINRSNKALVAEIEERKKNENTLRYRKALLEAQNEAIPDGILVVDTEGKILSYNHHFSDIWRIPQAVMIEIENEASLKFVTPLLANLDEFITRVHYIYTHPEEVAHDELLFKDGRVIERHGNAVMGDDGTRYGWAWYFRDITLNKNHEKKIKNFTRDLEIKVKERTAELGKSEKRFRSLIENAQDIISLTDENGMRFYVSPSIERITGFTIQESINRMVLDSVYPDDVEKVKAMKEELIREPGIIKPLFCRFKHKNGGYVWIEGTLVNLLHDENVKAVVGNFHDVTEKKINEEKIRVSNERFEIVSKATNDAVWDWNLETDEIHWNEEIKSMFNYCADDIATGAAWKVHIHPEDFKRVTRKLVYHIKNGIQNWQDEYRFNCADGTYKYVFNRGFILFDNTGKPYRIIGAMQDVTEINKLQQSLSDERIKKQKELTNATIEGQEKERTEIGRELHDNINQLLTATKLYLDVAATQPSMQHDMIKRSTENLSNCMEEIRRLSSSLVPPSMGLTNFTDILQDLIEPVKLATTINIGYDVKSVNKNILTNDQQLNVYRIIQEHLNNILKHAKANNVYISVKHVNDRIDINIKDDGQGFDVTVKRRGIGFKNIQSRAELLNGKMNVISEPGKGCLLVVNFPVKLLEKVK
ncbi:MAG: putative signal transduction histidine kinase [Chitinophagaceae bacterium]|nr:putative signal transduction histidine kinase [Chitinophagaceae bacterium]